MKLSSADTSAHIPALDGLRCLAIAGVMGVHLGLQGPINLGWAGVNLFFVLSGFLITGILLKTKIRPDYFRRFYTRRALRIFPIYYLVLLALMLLYAQQGKSLVPALWYLTYTQNFPLGATFESYHEVGFSEWFGHAWSLAVEEQFYLLWPLAVFLLCARRLLLLCIALIAFAIPFRLIACPVFGTKENWDLLPGQMDQLAIGAAVAILISGQLSEEDIRKAIRTAFLVIGASLILTFSMFDIFYAHKLLAKFSLWCGGIMVGVGLALSLGSGYSFPSWPRTPGAAFVATVAFGLLLCGAKGSYDFRWSPDGQWCMTLLAVLFAAFVYLAARSDTWFSAILCADPLVYIGKISYGVYIYHVLVYHAVDSYLPVGLASVAIKIGMTFIIASISYHFIEAPLLAKKDKILPEPTPALA